MNACARSLLAAVVVATAATLLGAGGTALAKTKAATPADRAPSGDAEATSEAFERFRSGCYSEAADAYARLYSENEEIAVLSDLAISLKLACRTEEARARFEELRGRCEAVRASLDVRRLKICDDAGSHLRELRRERYHCEASVCSTEVDDVGSPDRGGARGEDAGLSGQVDAATSDAGAVRAAELALPGPVAREQAVGWGVWGPLAGGVGAAGLAAAFSALAVGSDNASRSSCLPADPSQCDATGMALRAEARRYGDLATASSIAALVGLGAAGLVWLLSNRE